MTIIFIFSHASGDDSSKQSGLIISLITYLGIHVNERNLRIISLIVRKGAHMAEYFILTYACIRYYSSIGVKNMAFLAFSTSFLYACSDEFHQTFIPGRAGLFIDVLVDSIGMAAALICYILWKKFKRDHRHSDKI